MKILYLDMDNALVDFPSGIARPSMNQLDEYQGRLDEVPGMFALMSPMPKTISAFNELAKKYDTNNRTDGRRENLTTINRELLGLVSKFANFVYHHKYRDLVLLRQQRMQIERLQQSGL